MTELNFPSLTPHQARRVQAANLDHLPLYRAELGSSEQTSHAWSRSTASTGATAGPGGRQLQPISAERARAELADGVRACGVCRPDNVLNRL
ncbi:DUF6233 domain-containing protein [Streptomyces sp. NPDC045714]|uniref:DUF6233 domain-containing protein n=1 Tax=Streptomyces sp. NPDC045714 TaxID=3154913 RepID=UPI0033D3651B